MDARNIWNHESTFDFELMDSKQGKDMIEIHQDNGLGAILDAASDGILILDFDGAILFSNRSAAHLLSRSKEELDGWLFGSPVRLGDKVEIEVVHDHDNVRRLEMLASQIEWLGRKAIIACLRDITNHVQLQRSLSQRNDELELMNRELTAARDKAVDLSRLKSEFIANVSHEIRTPLAGILGLSEMLTMDESLDSEHLELIQQIYMSAERLHTVLTDLLDLSKLEAGRLALKPTEFSIRRVVNDVLESIRATSRQKNLEISAHIDESIPQLLIGDDLKIRQVLVNLAHNAVKFTERGSIRIDVHEIDAGINDLIILELSVMDTGIGINPKDQEKLFQPFVQVDGTNQRLFSGTGLGLSICKRLVELMGGNISLESALGIGSTFSFVVPLEIKNAG